MRDLVDYLETLRGPYGLWQHPTHPQLSCWLSFDLKSSLRRLGDGDWVGNEGLVSFTPYRCDAATETTERSVSHG